MKPAKSESSESGKPSPASKTPKETATPSQEKHQKPKGQKSTGPNQTLTAHRQSTLRTATTTNDKQRKAVFKSVLDSPYIVRWPTIGSEDNEDFVNLLCRTISPISEYKSALKRAKKEAQIQEKLQQNPYTSTQGVPQVPDEKLMESVVLGMNTVTKQLERMISYSAPVLTRKLKIRSEVKQHHNPGKRNMQSEDEKSIPKRQKLDEPTCGDSITDARSNSNESDAIDPSIQSDTLASSISKNRLRVLFLFKNDIQPPHLYMHLPALVTQAGDVRIVPLSKGSQARVAGALNLPRVTVIGIGGHTPELAYLCGLVESKIPPFDMPWLKQPSISCITGDEEQVKGPLAEESQPKEGIPSSIRAGSQSIYVATNIKTLKTSAPVKAPKNGKKGSTNVMKAT